METTIFEQYLKSVFLPAIGKERPVILVYDGHKTHVDLSVIEFLVAENITVIKLPAHSSHLLQPLDCSTMKPLKDKWDSELVKWQRLHVGAKLPKQEFARILTKIWDDLNPTIIENGFRKAGIWPLNKEAIPKEKFDSLTWSRWEEHQKQNKQPHYNTGHNSQEIVEKSHTKINNSQEEHEVPTLISACLKTINSGIRRMPGENNMTFGNITRDMKNKNLPTQNGKVPINMNSSTQVTFQNWVTVKDPKTFILSRPKNDHTCANSNSCNVKILENIVVSSIVNKSKEEERVSFEDLLLKTISRNDIPKTSKKRISQGSEVLTYKDAVYRLKNEKEKKEKAEETKRQRKQKRANNNENKKPVIKSSKKSKTKKNKRKKTLKSDSESDCSYTSVNSSEDEDRDVFFQNILEESIDEDLQEPLPLFTSGQEENRPKLKSERLNERQNKIFRQNEPTWNFHKKPTVLEDCFDENLQDPLPSTSKGQKALKIKSERGNEIKTYTAKKKIFTQKENKMPEPQVPEVKMDHKVGDYILVAFRSIKGKRTYKYVCLIEDINQDKIVVKGLKAKKDNKEFKFIENDISIIEKQDIISCLPKAVLNKQKDTKCEGKLQPELRKFSVDPQITSLEVLQSILVKAFDIKSDFTLSYRSADDYGQEIYLPLLSDWDLDAAFLKAHNIALTQRSEPCVQLKVDMKPFAEASEDWEPPSVSPATPLVNQNYKEPSIVTPTQQTEKQETQTGFQGMIMNQVEKTFNMVSRALNLYEDPNTPPRPPLSDIEFRAFLDTVGQITNTSKLREVIYCGGIDPSLRKVVWKHILNVYPEGMTGKERMDYIKRKANEYYALRARWKDCIQKGMVNPDLAYVTGMVRKDVLRTDRHHNFYAGSDDNQNIASLFNILTTYALNHPTVSYCQGMSDLASPLLVTMGDEAHAYICLCALMTRLYPNFLLDGEAMTLKFSHLTESLQVYDPDFYNYLKSQQADDLLFCYRWLLLEMKREFAFDDALRMLEVLWASLPYKTPTIELSLKEKEFDPSIEVDDDPPPLSPLVKAPRENAYTKVCAIRRQSSSFSLAHVKAPKLGTGKAMNHSLDENATRTIVNNTLRHSKEFQSLDDATLQLQKQKIDRYDTDKNKENSNSKDFKFHRGRSMKSVPEHEKCPQAPDAHGAWSSTGNLMNGSSHGDGKDIPLGNQIRLLRDKISVHNNRFSSSLDKLDDTVSVDAPSKPKVKMIKNLNEFLNFATGSKVGTVTQEKLQRTRSVIEKTSPKECPRITLTKTSLDDVRVQHSKSEKSNKINKNIYSDTNDGSSPDDSQEYYPMTTSMTRELRLELEHLDRQVFGPSYVNRCSMICDSPSDSTSTDDKPTHDCTEIKQEVPEPRPEIPAELLETIKRSPLLEAGRSNARSAEDIYLWENPLHRNTPTTRTTASCPQTPDEQAELDFDGDTGEIFEEHSGKKSVTPIRLLRKNQSLEPQEVYRDLKHSNTHSSESESSDKDLLESNIENMKNNQGQNNNTSRSQKFFSSMSQELENAKRNCESLLNAKQTNLHSVASTINSFQKKYEAFKPPIQKTASVSSVTSDGSAKNSVSSLPPPTLFGGGNPFLMFLCLTVLLQHRDYIMRNRMDYNELAMHFDKMVRKHNVNRVLNQARQMYAMYLKQQAHKTGDITT